MQVLLTIFLVLALNFFLIRIGRRQGWDRRIKQQIFTKLSSADVEYISQVSSFYRHADQKDKRLFEKRVAIFIASKRFEGRQKLEVDRKLKLLIASEAITISFGLPYFILPHFKTIIIYPQAYLSQQTNKLHLGEVNLAGAIVLSKESLVYKSEGRNLCVHEFAHALYFENFIKNENYLFIKPEDFKNLYALAESELGENTKGEKTPFRAYAFTNNEEFFAVLSEYFFEKPNYFEKRGPQLFYQMTQIYAIDPRLWRSE